jgi:hypothetical protein
MQARSWSLIVSGILGPAIARHLLKLDVLTSACTSGEDEWLARNAGELSLGHDYEGHW